MGKSSDLSLCLSTTRGCCRSGWGPSWILNRSFLGPSAWPGQTRATWRYVNARPRLHCFYILSKALLH